ncbi:hypothetical protein [Clostridium botulinum]|nr:hypothetical protein [Clostridium botulinum]
MFKLVNQKVVDIVDSAICILCDTKDSNCTLCDGGALDFISCDYD